MDRTLNFSNAPLSREEISQRIQWMTHKGKQILRLDYSNLSGDQMIPMIKNVFEYYEGKEQNSVRSIALFANVFTNDNVIQEFKYLTKQTKPYDLKAANVGVTGIKKLFFKMVTNFSGNDIKLFDTEEQALRWLVK